MSHLLLLHPLSPVFSAILLLLLLPWNWYSPLSGTILRSTLEMIVMSWKSQQLTATWNTQTNSPVWHRHPRTLRNHFNPHAPPPTLSSDARFELHQVVFTRLKRARLPPCDWPNLRLVLLPDSLLDPTSSLLIPAVMSRRNRSTPHRTPSYCAALPWPSPANTHNFPLEFYIFYSIHTQKKITFLSLTVSSLHQHKRLMTPLADSARWWKSLLC